jgi:hypothetical protein
MVRVKPNVDECGARVAGCRGSRRGDHSHRRRARKSVAPRAGRLFFSLDATRQVKRPPAADWLAGGVMLLAAASWGVLAALLAS